jgi:hypothetical protein
MPEHHHTREMSFTLLPASQKQITTSAKYPGIVYGRHIGNTKTLPR